jgi:hypothetical protein
MRVRERAVGVLEDDLHVAADRAQLLVPPALDVAPEEENSPLGRDEPHDGERGRGLARTGFAHDADRLAGPDGDVGAVDRLDVTGGAAQETALDREPDLEVLGVDDRRRALRHRIGLALRLGGEERAGVGVLRTREDLGRRTRLDDQALLHHRNAVGDPAHDVEVVGDEQHRHAALALDVGEQGQDLGLDRHVERGRWLVGDQDVRVVGECHGDHHALALAAGELVREGAQALLWVADADLVEELDNAGPGAVAGKPLVQREALADLLLDGVERVQRRHRLLEDEADVVAADAAQGAFGGAEHLGVAVADAAGDLGVLGQEADGGEGGHGLAGAGLADDRHRLAGSEVEGDAAHRFGALAALDEGDAQILDCQQRRTGRGREIPHRKVFRGSKASRTPSKMKTRSDSMIANVKKAVKPSQGALSRFLPWSASSPREG